jgi:hypothetical protein
MSLGHSNIRISDLFSISAFGFRIFANRKVVILLNSHHKLGVGFKKYDYNRGDYSGYHPGIDRVFAG